MRLVHVLGIAVAVTAGVAGATLTQVALAQTGTAAAPVASPDSGMGSRNAGTPKLRAAPVANPSSAANDKARAEAAAREKRWDERMKRVTRSMCTGC